MKRSDKTPESRFKKHLQIMDIEDSGFSSSQVNAEKRLINSIDLPPLSLESSSSKSNVSRSWWQNLQWQNLKWGGVLALAAAVALVFVMQKGEDSPGWQIKGKGSIKVFFQRDGTADQLDPEMRLLSGDQVRVELLAVEAGVAFMGVIDKEGELLSTPDQVWNSQIEVAAGTTGTFGGSVELTEPNQGEAIVVWRCPASEVTLVRGVLTNFSKLTDIRRALPDCDFYQQKLR